MQIHDFFKLLKNFYFKNREIKNCCNFFYNIIKKIYNKYSKNIIQQEKIIEKK